MTSVLMPPLSELTIICLSYERQSYIRRQIAYFSDSPVKLVIADGSHYPMMDWELSELVNLPLRFKYIHLSGASTYQKRLELALEEVDTPFVTLMDDADILFKSGLARAVFELRHNQDISIAAGKVGCFSNDEHLNQRFYSNWWRWSRPLSLEAAPQTKLLEMIRNMRTGNLFYVVTRKDTFIECIEKILNARISTGCAFELFLAAFFVIRSNFKLGDYPFWMRGDVPSVPTKVYDKYSYAEWHVMNEEDRKNFISYLASELANVGKLEHNEAVKVIEDYLLVHYHQCIDSERVIRDGSIFGRYFHRLHRYIRSILISHRLGIALLRIYRFFRYGEAHVGLDIIRYWESVGADLAVDQATDLRGYDYLLSRFPRGIESTLDLHSALDASCVKAVPQR